MNDEERKELAERIVAKRKSAFDSKKDAYTAAHLNAGTWDNAENGKSMKDYKLEVVVKTLWPATGGDWRLIDQVEGVEGPAAAELVATAPSTETKGLSNEQLLAELADRLGLEVSLWPKADPQSAEAGEGKKTSIISAQGVIPGAQKHPEESPHTRR